LALARSPYLLETSLPGVFAVGDVRSGSVKRAASAVGKARSRSPRSTGCWPSEDLRAHQGDQDGAASRQAECAECVKIGAQWVHLRVCQQCGATLCCDDSPNRHATKHANATKHPVIASGEPESGGCIAIPMISSSSIETREFARAAALGLSDHPRWLPCRYLYDAEGSRLFERITETPEYYLTRTELSLLDESSEAIAQITGDATLVELGAGSARKTERILAAYTQAYGAARYVPSM